MNRAVLVTALLLLALPFFTVVGAPASVWAASQSIEVHVVYVVDGDSIMVQKDNQRLEVRLWGIDAPEFDQPWSQLSRRNLERLVKRKVLLLKLKGTDKYGRTLAIAYHQDMPVNELLVAGGDAWVHRYYCNEEPCKKWLKLEAAAREKGLGLWQQHRPIPPWKWKAKWPK